MHKLITLALVSLFAANVALAQTPAAAPAKPATPAPAATPADGCEAHAVSKAGKPLHGAAKAAFMKKCAKDMPASATADGKSTQQNKMKTCNKDATGKKGAERKAFMKECLSK
jgi:hypothetical protein